MGKIREYAKLARSFNMVLTGVAPVMGLLSMEVTVPWKLVVGFLMGCGAHIYGFVLNDYMDVNFDRRSKELDRPLVSGTVTPRGALAFALSGLAVTLGCGVVLSMPSVVPVLILLAATGSATVYNLWSKRFPGMDVFVAGAVYLLCLASVHSAGEPTTFAHIICLLAFLQVLFMNIVAGGLKDIDHDALEGGRTLAVVMGARVKKDGGLVVPASFTVLAVGIQLTHLSVTAAPYLMGMFPWTSPQPWSVLCLGAAMLGVSWKILGMKKFQRDRMRRYIGLHYALNFSLAPVLLSSLIPWAFVIAFLPPLGFVISNMLVHSTIAEPKSM